MIRPLCGREEMRLRSGTANKTTNDHSANQSPRPDHSEVSESEPNPAPKEGHDSNAPGAPTYAEAAAE